MNRHRVFSGPSYRKKVKVTELLEHEQEQNEEEEEKKEKNKTKEEEELIATFDPSSTIVNHPHHRIVLVVGHPKSTVEHMKIVLGESHQIKMGSTLVNDLFLLIAWRYRFCQWSLAIEKGVDLMYRADVDMPSSNRVAGILAEWWDDNEPNLDYEEKWIDECVQRLECLLNTLLTHHTQRVKFTKKLTMGLTGFWETLGYSPLIGQRIAEIVGTPPTHLILKYGQLNNNEDYFVPVNPRESSKLT